MIFMQKAAARTAAGALLCLGSVSHGTSADARFVAGEQMKGYGFLLNSNAFGVGAPVADGKLLQVFRERQQPDWDGYGALGVSSNSLQVARELLRALPIGTATPEFGADPDGELTFEWYKSGQRTLSVSVSSEGDLHYAAIIGARKSYGTEPFFGEVPRTILELIGEVMA